MKKSHTLNKEDENYILIHICIAVFYLLFFYVILQSSFAADDLFNSNAAAANYMEGDSVWKLTLRQYKLWMIDNGRFYPFSNYTYLLFSILPNRFCYKLLLLVSVYLNSFLMSKCVEHITDSKVAGLIAMLLFPFSLQLTPRYDGPIYCFHLLMQVVMLGSELSLLACFKYLSEKERNKHAYLYQVFGAFAFMISLGTYEIAFVMAAFLGLSMWAYTGSIKKSIRVLLPDIVVYLIMFGLNMFFRFRAREAVYTGVSINLDPKLVFITFLRQLYSTFPFAGFFVERAAGVEWNKGFWLEQFSKRDIIMIVLYVVLVCFIYRMFNQYKDNVKGKKVAFLLASGLLMMIGPSLLISVTSRYQGELYWGNGHISNYMQNFGLMLVLFSCVMLILLKWNVTAQRIFVGFVILSGIPFLLGQEWEARIDVEIRRAVYGYPRDTVLEAAKLGIFDEIDMQDTVFGMSNYIFDSAQTKSFYTYAAKKEIPALEKANILPVLTEQFGEQYLYELADSDQEYYATMTLAGSQGGCMMLGRIYSVELDQETREIKTILLENPVVYIKGESVVDPTDWQMIKQNKKGIIYQYDGVCEMI